MLGPDLGERLTYDCQLYIRRLIRSDPVFALFRNLRALYLAFESDVHEVFSFGCANFHMTTSPTTCTTPIALMDVLS